MLHCLNCITWFLLQLGNVFHFIILFSNVFDLEILRFSWLKCIKLTTEQLTVSFIELLLFFLQVFGSKSKIENLLYIPDASQQSPEDWWKCFNRSNKFNGFFKISQDALTRYLLNEDTADLIDDLNSDGSSESLDYKTLSHLSDFQKESRIKNLEVYHSSLGWLLDPFGIYHTFIVFKTISETEGDYWWSLEKNTTNIVMQRSRNKFAVVNRLERKDRKHVQIISRKENEGKGTMSDLLTTLWAHNVIPVKYHVVKSSCQPFVQFMENANNPSFVDFARKLITKENKQEATIKQKKISFNPVLTFSPPLEKSKSKLLINLVNKFPKWKPLFAIVYLGDHVLLENLLGNNDDNLGDNGITLLRLAILLSRTKMVEILLRHPGLNLTTPQNENSEMPWKYMSIFHTAAAFTNDTKILDLLLKHSKVKNDTDAQGRSALHIAVMESNETTVRHLLKIKLIDPNARDQNGLSPLHLAAHHTVKTKIIDLIIQATKANPCDRGFDDCDS
jgi:hypothetical protein